MTEPFPEIPSRLAFRQVSRKFQSRELPAVDGVSLDVPDGEVFALLGESGSGKTTLLRLAAGLETPDAGSVWLDGTCVAGDAREGKDLPPEKRRIGLVFQDGALFPHLNAEKNVAFGLSSWSREDRERRVKECLELVELAGFEKRFPHELSGGEGQRLSLARALAPEPQLLLLDEPFSHLDPALRRKLREELNHILERVEQTVLLVTHDPEDALTMASQVAILVQGKIRQVGVPSEVYRNPVDHYCGERFGPINEVPKPGSGATCWRRPEDATWQAVPEGGSDTMEGTVCHVVSVRPMGREFEVRVRREGAASDWLLSLAEAPAMEERGVVRWCDRE